MRLLYAAAWLYWIIVGAWNATLPQMSPSWSPASPQAIPLALSCRQDLIFSLDEFCQVRLSPQQVLLGGDVNTDWERLQVIVNDRNPFNRNIVDGAGRFAYLVRDIFSGNIICQSNLIVEDKRAPQVQSTDWQLKTIEWLCFDIDSILNVPASWQNPNYTYYTGRPVFADNCGGPLNLKVKDEVVIGECDSSFFAKIYRNFSVEDQAGNRSDTTQLIVLLRPDWKKLIYPRDTAIHSCIPEALRTPMLYPFWINGVGDTTVFNHEYCSLTIQREVSEILICRRGRKIVQTLKVFDWCAGQIVHTDTTLIKIGDLEAPVISKPSKPIVVSTQPMDCTASIPITPDQLQRSYQIGFSDCDAVQLTVKVKSYVFRPSVGDSVWRDAVYPISNGVMGSVPVGKHRFIFYASDPCFNSRTDSLELQVKDKIAPQMRCDNTIRVSISNGYDRLTVADIDEGSTDNCALLSLKVRRVIPTSCTVNFDDNLNGVIDTSDAVTLENGIFYTLPADRVEFFCCDVGTKVRVELIGRDAAGNISRCWMDVTVEDKTLLQCAVPADTSTLCSDINLGNFNNYGAARVLNDPCGLLSLVTLPTLDKRNNCGVGTITRRWQVVRNLGKPNEQRSPECYQVITVSAIRDYSIRFPRDTSVHCLQIPPGNTLWHQENGCNILAFNVTDVRFTASGQECYKIFRTWSIINWCEYVDGTEPVILDRDYDGNGERGDTAFWLLVRSDGHTYIDKNQIVDDSIPNNQGYWTSSKERPLLKSRGIWEYTQVIKVFDDEAPKITLIGSRIFDARNNDCTGDVNYTFSIAENCNAKDMQVQVFYDEKADGKVDRTLKPTGTYPRFRIQEKLPIGIHKIEIVAADGCGNTSREMLQIEIRDVKGPSPICINGLVVELMPLPQEEDIDGDGDLDAGAALIWAKDFVASKVEDCSGIVGYSIHRADDIESGKEKPDPNHTGIALTCDDRYTVLVYVYAWDIHGNYGYCETYVLVQDNRGLCQEEGGASISGVLKTFSNNPVEQVKLNLSGIQNAEVYSNTQGAYSFQKLKENNDYTISPSLNLNHLDGVSTYDIVLITKHILGQTPFDNPYKFIAADVDLSGYVSTLDIIQIRKVILRLDLEFKKCPSWRFVDASFRFADNNDPLATPFPELRNFNNLNSELLSADFVAVKMGDISGNAARESLHAAPELRSIAEAPLLCSGLPEVLRAGQEYRLTLDLSALPDAAGAQFTLAYHTHALQFVAIEYGAAGVESFGLNDAERGLIRMSWVKSAEKGSQLATLTFQAKSSVNSAGLFHLEEKDLASEGYTQAGEVKKLFLQRDMVMEAPGYNFQLYPNAPNPFSTSTTIEFDLGEPGSAVLCITDLSGRVLKTITRDYVAGHHEIVLQKSELNQTGVLLYTLKAGKDAKTMKMVVY
ncbi:MAG TPA: T9SS type A sorting domain-containing protein [Haliscomenobacter sp.]|uniref:T9SS type A sorting domain-containing protein n=1 Tax=Haliscomenobacter sp. TaxID=2717303 RepID=UPI002BC5AC81|nr:T9SS type A sorting domain-containing protein [Haliscomenobacter sp.]HOY19718.1 T9SS type A sorting domain-containing protein [Haliscomenobacter sp.]